MLAVEDFIVLTIVCLFLGIEIFFLIKASKGKHAWQRRSEYQKLSALVTAAACVILGIAFCNRDFDDDFFPFMQLFISLACCMKLFQKIPAWLKFFMILGLFFYNPFDPMCPSCWVYKWFSYVITISNFILTEIFVSKQISHGNS